MTNVQTGRAVDISQVSEIVVENGYEILSENDACLRVRDLETGIPITLVLEEDVLFNSVSCKTVPQEDISPATMHDMLSADNAISTSSFQLYDLENNKVAITLNNFCKLQTMGAEDEDDILSCLSFLLIDTVAARALLDS